MSELETFYKFAYAQPTEVRRRLITWLQVAGKLMEPPPSVRVSAYPSRAERRRRALEPRPGDYMGVGR